MIRSMFLACGLFVSLCGGALLAVDRIVLTDAATRELRAHLPAPTEEAPQAASSGKEWQLIQPIGGGDGTEVDMIDPPDWSAFAFLSAGCVTILYACSLPGRRVEEEDEDSE